MTQSPQIKSPPQSPKPQQPALHDINRVVSLFQGRDGERKYYTGYLWRRVELNSDGKAPTSPSDAHLARFDLFFAQLTGAEISLWNAAEMESAAARGESVGPSFLHISDAFVSAVDPKSIAQAGQPPPSAPYVFSMNNAGANRILFAPVQDKEQGINCLEALKHWLNCIRLAQWEMGRLNEIYTGTLLGMRPEVSARLGPTLNKGRMEESVQVRLPGSGTEWHQAFMVITDNVIAASADAKQNRRLSFQMLSKSGSSSNIPLQSETGSTIAFYASRRSKKPFFALNTVIYAAAVYPENPKMIKLAHTMKVEGLCDWDISGNADAPPDVDVPGKRLSATLSAGKGENHAAVLIMPDSSDRDKQTTMLNIMMGILEAFRLWGRTSADKRISFNPRDPSSPYFAFPIGPNRDRLFFDVPTVLSLEPWSNKPTSIRAAFGDLMAQKMAAPGKQAPPTPNLTSSSSTQQAPRANGLSAPERDSELQQQIHQTASPRLNQSAQGSDLPVQQQRNLSPQPAIDVPAPAAQTAQPLPTSNYTSQLNDDPSVRPHLVQEQRPVLTKSESRQSQTASRAPLLDIIGEDSRATFNDVGNYPQPSENSHFDASSSDAQSMSKTSSASSASVPGPVVNKLEGTPKYQNRYFNGAVEPRQDLPRPAVDTAVISSNPIDSPESKYSQLSRPLSAISVRDSARPRLPDLRTDDDTLGLSRNPTREYMEPATQGTSTTPTPATVSTFTTQTNGSAPPDPRIRDLIKERSAKSEAYQPTKIIHQADSEAAMPPAIPLAATSHPVALQAGNTLTDLRNNEDVQNALAYMRMAPSPMQAVVDNRQPDSSNLVSTAKAPNIPVQEPLTSYKGSKTDIVGRDLPEHQETPARIESVPQRNPSVVVLDEPAVFPSSNSPAGFDATNSPRESTRPLSQPDTIRNVEQQPARLDHEHTLLTDPSHQNLAADDHLQPETADTYPQSQLPPGKSSRAPTSMQAPAEPQRRPSRSLPIPPGRSHALDRSAGPAVNPGLRAQSPSRSVSSVSQTASERALPQPSRPMSYMYSPPMGYGSPMMGMFGPSMPYYGTPDMSYSSGLPTAPSMTFSNSGQNSDSDNAARSPPVTAASFSDRSRSSSQGQQNGVDNDTRQRMSQMRQSMTSPPLYMPPMMSPMQMNPMQMMYPGADLHHQQFAMQAAQQAAHQAYMTTMMMYQQQQQMAMNNYSSVPNSPGLNTSNNFGMPFQSPFQSPFSQQPPHQHDTEDIRSNLL